MMFIPIFVELFNRDLGVLYNRLQRPLMAQSVFDTRKRVILCQASLQLVRRLAARSRHPLDFGVDLPPADLDLLDLADLVEDQRHANVTLRQRAELLHSLLPIDLFDSLRRDAVAHQNVREFAGAVDDLRLDPRGRDLEGIVIKNPLAVPVTKIGLGPRIGGRRQIFPNPVAQLLEIFIVAEIPREFVVEFRRLFFADRDHSGREVNSLAGQPFRGEIFRVFDAELADVAGLHVAQILAEFGLHAVGADLDLCVVGLQILFFRRFDVLADQIDRNEVAVTCLPVFHRDEFRRGLAQMLERMLDLLVGHGRHSFGQFQTLVLFKLEFRQDFDRRPEPQGFAFADREVANLRVADDAKHVFDDGGLQRLRNQALNDLFSRLFGETLLDEFPRDASGAESRNLQMARVGPVGLFKGRVALLNGDFNFEISPTLGEISDIDLQLQCSLPFFTDTRTDRVEMEIAGRRMSRDLVGMAPEGLEPSRLLRTFGSKPKTSTNSATGPLFRALHIVFTLVFE